MISDRDPRFTSHFGKALTTKLGISCNLSTAFHPQTDGLSEWKNQWVEQYLCLVTSMDPKWWNETTRMQSGHSTKVPIKAVSHHPNTNSDNEFGWMQPT